MDLAVRIENSDLVERNFDPLVAEVHAEALGSLLVKVSNFLEQASYNSRRMVLLYPIEQGLGPHKLQKDLVSSRYDCMRHDHNQNP